MRKQTVAIVCLVLLYPLCWVFCEVWKRLDRAGVLDERIVYVETVDPASRPGAAVLDANNAFFTVVKAEPNRVEVRWSPTEIHAEHPTCRVKRLDGPPTSVMGMLNGERQYPVLIDTGCNQSLIVNDVVALESGLGLCPIEVELDSGLGGFCRVEQLEIGGMTMLGPPCCYTRGHYERRAFGKGTQKEEQVILGLNLMRGFRYLLIDHIALEVEFGLRRSFTPDPNESWHHFPLVLDTPGGAGPRAIVQIPMAGQTRRVTIDTAAGWNLYVGRDVWEVLSDEVSIVETSRSRSKMFRGWTDVEKVIVEQFPIGRRTLRRATITVVDESAAWKPGMFLLGMDNFADTAITLDFEDNRFWIRDPPNQGPTGADD